MATVAVTAAPQRVQRNPRTVSMIFYRAVRDLKPVWLVEDIRRMETFSLEENAGQRTYSPAEALLYAVVHDHRAYAEYLLSRYKQEALQKPGERFCGCQSSAPHLVTAVRYDRPHILRLILRETHRMPGMLAFADRGGCFHLENGRRPLHVACEHTRPDAVIALLGNGASPDAADEHGLTPLDVLLEKIRQGKKNKGRERRQCLDNLLMFTPKLRFKMKGALQRDPELWTRLLGEETYQYLSGRSPGPLVLSAMQTVLKQLDPATFPDSLLELPIPTSLKPAGLAVSQWDRQRLL